MKQGKDFVYVKVSLAVFDVLKGEWSRPVQLRLDEEWDGTLELVTRDVADQSLRELARSL